MFYVGQKVVCVDDSRGQLSGDDQSIVLGGIYTISAITTRFPELAVQVAELGYAPWQFCRASRFRPVVDRPTDISVFTAMLNTKPAEIDA